MVRKKTGTIGKLFSGQEAEALAHSIMRFRGHDKLTLTLRGVAENEGWQVRDQHGVLAAFDIMEKVWDTQKPKKVFTEAELWTLLAFPEAVEGSTYAPQVRERFGSVHHGVEELLCKEPKQELKKALDLFWTRHGAQLRATVPDLDADPYASVNEAQRIFKRCVLDLMKEYKESGDLRPLLTLRTPDSTKTPLAYFSESLDKYRKYWVVLKDDYPSNADYLGHWHDVNIALEMFNKDVIPKLDALKTVLERKQGRVL